MSSHFLEQIQFPRPDLVEAYLGRLDADPGELAGSNRRDDYLYSLGRIVGFFSEHQNAEGAIIDPYLRSEWHYSTPCYALAAAVLVSEGDESLRASAEKAMVNASVTLSSGKAPQGHADFFTAPLMLADQLLREGAAAEPLEKWQAALAGIDAETIYDTTDRKQPQPNNWSVINLTGEFLRYSAGLGGEPEFWERHLDQQIQRFDEFGFYLDGRGHDHPLAYDLISRYHLAALLRHGYSGRHAEALRKILLRGAVTSLFVQAPTGEWPGVGRSSHHQWNDASLAAIYEWAATELNGEAPELAAACRRGAQLAVGSVMRWHRAGGDLNILRNRFEPEERHGFEHYSVHTTYNLWTAAALAFACDFTGGGATQAPLPSEIGGYVLELSEAFHQVIAADRGWYLQIDKFGTPSTNPTGLIRINRAGCNAQIGPSEGCVAQPRYEGIGARDFLSYAPAWRDRAGLWHRLAALAEQPGPALSHFRELPRLISGESSGAVDFSLLWSGTVSPASELRAHYEVSEAGVSVTYEVAGSVTGLRAEFPLFEFDGQEQSTIERVGREIVVRYAESRLTIAVPDAECRIVVTDEVYMTRTGWLRRAYAETRDRSIRFQVRLELNELANAAAR
jgi:hypothetical protein